MEISKTYKAQLEGLGIEIKNESRWLNAVSVLCQKAALDNISNFPFVEKMEPVIGYKKPKLVFGEEIEPNSRDYDYGNAQAQIEQINVHELHNAGYTGENVRILVMDTGFDLTHNVFANINVIDQWDFINDDNETANETSYEHSENQDFHGTAVLSTIAGNAPGEFMGVAFDAEFLLAKTEDVPQEYQLEEDNYVAGLEWGEANGADVVSTSLGYLDWYTYEDLDGNTAVTTNAVDIAVGLGMVCVTAAGNEGNHDWYYIITPADADSVIAVGAVKDNGDIASFSSHGPTYDGRIKPEVCARGYQTWCINPNSTTTYTRMSGTSLACPLVGGATVLIRQAQPDWSAMQVREAMMMTASISNNPDNTYGYGILNAGAAIEYDQFTGINDNEVTPGEFHLLSTYPNPFNPAITIKISSSVGAHLIIDVFSLSGKLIKTLYSGTIFQKIIKLNWHPQNLPSGIYLIRSRLNDHVRIQKITLIK
jgi:subtilisin family serine protease